MSTPLDAYLRYLKRQEQAILSRIGAGLDLRTAFQPARWTGELAADLGLSTSEAANLVGSIRNALALALVDLNATRERVLAVRVAYAEHRSRAELYVAGAVGTTPAGQHLVYLLYEEAGELLYVGITDRGPVRLVEHHRSKPWFPAVVRVEFERYATRADSERREKFLISSRAPRHNVIHNQGRHRLAG